MGWAFARLRWVLRNSKFKLICKYRPEISCNTFIYYIFLLKTALLKISGGIQWFCR